MIKSTVENLTLALANRSIQVTVEDRDVDQVHLTVEKEKLAYSLFLTSEYASFSETYFNQHIGYDEREIFEEEGFEIVALANKIANYIEHEIDQCRKEDEYLMSLLNDDQE